ncbi:MAG: hypothetical protein IT340_09400 [Chloroflexi bacterium]|nr:hypothetical protein [Chloroflexota bacterium]
MTITAVSAPAARPPRVDAAADPADAGWRGLFPKAGSAALAIVLIALLDIVLTFVPGMATPDPGAGTVADWFAILQANWFLGLRGLGLWNVLTLLLMTPVILALWAAHRRSHAAHAALATVLLVIGAAVYIANNPALAMLGLSHQHAAATAAAERALALARGDSLLARAEDFTPDAFLGLVLPLLAEIMMALIMLRGGVFGKAAGAIVKAFRAMGLTPVAPPESFFVAGGEGRWPMVN